MRAVIAILLCLAFCPIIGAAEENSAAGTNDLIELKGKVIPERGTTNLQFRVEAGPVYKLLPARDAKALFADTNLHHRVLLLKGRLHAAGFETIGILHAIRNGKVYELYYHCDICSIETSFPGPCMCCREPVILLEREIKRE